MKCGITRRISARRQEGDWFEARPKPRRREIPWPHTGTTHYHAQLVLPDQGCAIKWLVVCYVVWLESMKGMGLGTCASPWVWSFVIVWITTELKYRNTLQKHHIT